MLFPSLTGGTSGLLAINIENHCERSSGEVAGEPLGRFGKTPGKPRHFTGALRKLDLLPATRQSCLRVLWSQGIKLKGAVGHGVCLERGCFVGV